jgi:hypothetical protein
VDTGAVVFWDEHECLVPFNCISGYRNGCGVITVEEY